MKYYKRYNDQFYDFDQAYDMIEKNNLKNVVMRVKNKFVSPYMVEVSYDMIKENKKSISIPVWAAKSDNWSLWEPDYEKQNVVDEIADWMQDELKFDLDSRFYNADNMSIDDWWNQLNDHILIEDDCLAIMRWLMENKRLNNWKKRNNEYYNRM